MTDTIKKIMDVFGDELPSERHVYGATEKSPVPVRSIIKEFGSYAEFYKVYKLERVKARNLEKEPIQKAPPKKEIKRVTK